MPVPEANTAWFTLHLNGRTDFEVYAFTGRETICRPYEFTLELVHSSSREELAPFIGAPALLTIADRSGQGRLVHGLVREMKRLRRGNHLTHYECVIVPRLWFLEQTRNHRIFQHKSVPEIITRILGEQNFTAESFAFKCFHKYPSREYCVQYGESDLHFISRLCEEEGIYYYFEHSENGHCLCFSDMPGGPRIGGESDLRYFPGSGQPADTAVVSRLALRSQSVSDRATLRDWNFITPSSILESSESEPDSKKAPAASGMRHDVYRYPYLHDVRNEGDRYARLQLLRQITMQTAIELEADVSRFLPGFTFSLHGHDREEVNAGWWVVSVFCRGEQPQTLGREAPDRGMTYTARATAIPEATRFVPESAHPKNRIMGDQTALVTGPAGEEIYTDKYGRVKVQFFWDREGKRDGNTSCWIRASQGWAGLEYGCMAIPRIGQEVIVSFLEGDPDRPIITGRLYNAGSMPPYELPEHKTRTVFRSMSTPGGEGPRGFNELRIEDRAGEEEIYLHAEKDVNIHVKNDWKEHILRDRHRTVDRHVYVLTERETHETLDGERKTELHANDNLTVHAASHTAIDGSWLRRVGSETHLYAGEKAVFEAGTEATLRGGSSWIRLDPSGVAMGGAKVSLGGGGGGGAGTPARPLLPVAALPVNAGEAPNATLPAPAVREEEKQKSDGELRIGVFFDGSGAHKDKPGDPYTNIAKLYDYYQREPGKYYKIYAHGVGVKFTPPDPEPRPGETPEGSYHWDPISLGCGTGGEGGNADKVWNIVFKDFLRYLGEVDLSTVKRITLDVFGFSRGAALARHFVNAVEAYGLPNPAASRTSGTMPAAYRDITPNMLVRYDPVGQYVTYEKLKCETVIGFVGLFDTVGAFYWPKNFDEGNFRLLLPAAVLPRTYQIAAADEYRKIYALYDVKESALQDDMPGCHSDIGGGYAISDAPEDRSRNRHSCSYVYLGKAIVNKEFGDPSISELHVPGDQRLQALCEKLLKGFVEMETARRRWRSFPREKEALFLAQQEKAGIRFRIPSGSEYPNEYAITIFKIKEELIDLRYVYLLKMHRKALSFNVPLLELEPADMRSIQTVLDLANNDYHKFWERYIHLSSQGYANYAHCYTATPDGEIILRPELAPDQLPRMTYPSAPLVTLAMGTSEDAVRPRCDNNGNTGQYVPNRLPLPTSMEGLS